MARFHILHQKDNRFSCLRSIHFRCDILLFCLWKVFLLLRVRTVNFHGERLLLPASLCHKENRIFLDFCKKIMPFQFVHQKKPAMLQRDIPYCPDYSLYPNQYTQCGQALCWFSGKKPIITPLSSISIGSSSISSYSS